MNKIDLILERKEITFEEMDNKMAEYCNNNRERQSEHCKTAGCGQCIVKYILDNYNVTRKQIGEIMEYTDYKQAANYDADLCTTIAMEECSEFIQAISKAKRGKLDRDNLVEEIVDVCIVIDWLVEIYDIQAEEFNKWHNFKTDRIVKRLNKGTFK